MPARRGFRAASVPGADHFFTGRLEGFEEAAIRLLGEAGFGAPVVPA